MSESFLNDRVQLHCGDMRDVLAMLAENSIDSCVCDPPYHLTSIVWRMSAPNAAPVGFASDGRYQRLSGGFMGKVWDGGDIAFRPETWAAVYRVLKPGAHLIAFGGTRTFHRLACAIEDAGFEIRDTVSWLYGSGFPKSHDVSKGIDRAAGAEREIVGRSARHVSGKPEQRTEGLCGSSTFAETIGMGAFETAPATDAAREWTGWGTALKPAMELCVLARKPLSEGTVAANVLRWGTGAINVDGCRVASEEIISNHARSGNAEVLFGAHRQQETYQSNGQVFGRWPANVAHDGSDEVVAAFPDSNGGTFAQSGERAMRDNPIYGVPNTTRNAPDNYGDTGSAARFFKACPLTEDDLRWARNRHDDTSIHEQIDISENGGNREAERSIANSKIDGYGNENAAQFQMDLMSTTSTTTAPITGSKISSSSQEQNTTPIINGCAKPIEPNQTEASAVNVSGVPNGKHSTTFMSEWPEHSTDIANDVSGNTCRNGETGIANTGTPIIENIAGKRFHYTSKADADDRLGSRHPTVKPLDLMQWLVRLVTPPRGLVLDPFAGTGTTGEAAWREGMAAVLIEAEPEYQADIRRRMALVLAGPDERARESIKARNLPRDDGPLFAFVDDYDAVDDFARSIDEAYRVIRARKAAGGKGWGGWE